MTHSYVFCKRQIQSVTCTCTWQQTTADSTSAPSQQHPTHPPQPRTGTTATTATARDTPPPPPPQLPRPLPPPPTNPKTRPEPPQQPELPQQPNHHNHMHSHNYAAGNFCCQCNTRCSISRHPGGLAGSGGHLRVARGSRDLWCPWGGRELSMRVSCVYCEIGA